METRKERKLQSKLDAIEYLLEEGRAAHPTFSFLLDRFFTEDVDPAQLEFDLPPNCS